MTFEELTPESAFLSSLLSCPSAVNDSSLLQQLVTDRLVMGSTKMMHVTGLGKRMLLAKVTGEL